MDKPDKNSMTLWTFGVYLAMTFGWTWGIATLLILFPGPIEAVFGKLSGTNPVFILAVWGPGLAGAFLVWWHYGLEGLGRFFRRLTLVRMPAAWWLFLVFGIPANFYLGAALKGNLADPFPFSPWYGVIPATLIALFIGPVEEFGWRGLALPLLQRRLAPFWASVVLGVIVGVWHLPAFVLSGTPQESWSFSVFFFSAIVLTVLFTGMFNASRGSLLTPVLFHFQGNGPAWPDAQPWDIVGLCLVAIIVIAVNRRAMFTKEGAVTDVLMPAAGQTDTH